MRVRGLILLGALAIAACAPQTSDFTEACRAEDAARPIPPGVQARLNEEQTRQYRESNVQSCERFRAAAGQIEHQRRWAPVVAGAMVAASDALATHNLFVYDVPRAQRYLRR